MFHFIHKLVPITRGSDGPDGPQIKRPESTTLQIRILFVSSPVRRRPAMPGRRPRSASRVSPGNARHHMMPGIGSLHIGVGLRIWSWTIKAGVIGGQEESQPEMGAFAAFSNLYMVPGRPFECRVDFDSNGQRRLYITTPSPCLATLEAITYFCSHFGSCSE